MKRIFYIIVLVLAAILILRYAPPQKFSPSPEFFDPAYQHVDLTIGTERFEALVAGTEALKEKGLSGLARLGEREAMLFPYDEPSSLPFWMKDMLFSIDILWLDAEYRVVHLQKDVSPSTYPETFSSDVPARYVIELSAGTLNRLGVKTGDKASISPKK